MHQDVSHDLPQVHAADHLLIPQRAKRAKSPQRCSTSAGRYTHLSGPEFAQLLPLFPRVGGAIVYKVIKLCAEVIQFAAVPKRPPLHVNAHTPFVTIHQIDVPHLLHVAGVGPCA